MIFTIFDSKILKKKPKKKPKNKMGIETNLSSNQNMSDSTNKKAFREGSILRVYNVSPFKRR